MIRAEGVTKVFGKNEGSAIPLLEQGKTKDEIQAETGHIVGVKDANFELEPGEVFCIMGLSGSGKSTLIRCVNRLIDPTAGRIFFKDRENGEREITAMNDAELRELRKHDMSMVFQHFALFPHRTVLANTIYGLEIQHRNAEESQQVGRKVLDMVGLGGWEDAYPHELSGGMQQRVGLARALATEAKVLLMDEPFSALDPLIKVNMQRELTRIQKELDRTILFITHDLDEAMRIGNHIAIMDAGEVVQIGNPEDILVNPKTEYVANFVEHADPTGVLTAGTIVLPFDDTQFERVAENGELVYYVRRSHPEGFRFGIDRKRRLQAVVRPGHHESVEIAPLVQIAEHAAEIARTGRRDDIALRCDAQTVLRTVLKGRSCSTVPTVVTDADGRLRGIIDEPELIHGILEKRGHREHAEATAADEKPSAGGAG